MWMTSNWVALDSASKSKSVTSARIGTHHVGGLNWTVWNLSGLAAHDVRMTSCSQANAQHELALVVSRPTATLNRLGLNVKAAQRDRNYCTHFIPLEPTGSEEAGPRHTRVMCDLVGLHLGLEPGLVRAPNGHWM
jgi:hypothetical protein